MKFVVIDVTVYDEKDLEFPLNKGDPVAEIEEIHETVRPKPLETPNPIRTLVYTLEDKDSIESIIVRSGELRD